MHGDNKPHISANRGDNYGVIAHWYDELYSFRDSVDLQFFLSCAGRPGMRILELGCGTGRISIPLARAGQHVTALDLSQAMLARLREKLAAEPGAVQEHMVTVQGSMAEFDLAERFDLILIPFRAFQHLLTTAEQRSCLACIRRHLAEDGRLVLDLFDPDITKIAGYVAAAGRFSQDLEKETADGGLLRRYSRIVADTRQQIHEVSMRFERLDARGRTIDNDQESFRMRWMTHNECVLLLELCGLEISHVQSGYDGSPLEDRQGELIYTCRRSDGQ